ncbi:MAG TPA: DUF1573 domain-containing protein [Thermoanaerobaculia bacterium]|jgi:hypothetical protein|nr:DUF1573 domain-containing protein [Thermoanaerobaculia bacterium]
MSDEFGTVNVRRGDRAREIEVIRQHYKAHRDALTRMMGDAPTEHLASEYQRLVQEIDTALAKLDELEARPAPATMPNVPAAGVMPPERLRTEPGTRPLVAPPAAAPLPDVGMYDPPMDEPRSSSRVLLIVVIGLVVLGIIGWLIWRASDRGATNPIVEAPATTATQPISDTAAVDTGTTVPVVSAPAPAPSGALRITPALQDYGTIRKGTRAVRQFEVTNITAAPITIMVARSQCKCLYYDYRSTLVPKKKETITVTVDGARAPAGDLRETLAVTAKGDPSVNGRLEVSATIR